MHSVTSQRGNNDKHDDGNDEEDDNVSCSYDDVIDAHGDKSVADTEQAFVVQNRNDVIGSNRDVMPLKNYVKSCSGDITSINDEVTSVNCDITSLNDDAVSRAINYDVIVIEDAISVERELVCSSSTEQRHHPNSVQMSLRKCKTHQMQGFDRGHRIQEQTQERKCKGVKQEHLFKKLRQEHLDAELKFKEEPFEERFRPENYKRTLRHHHSPWLPLCDEHHRPRLSPTPTRERNHSRPRRELNELMTSSTHDMMTSSMRDTMTPSTQLAEILAHVRYVTSRMKEDSRRDGVKDEWKLLARVLDRLLLIIFIVGISSLTAAILYVYPTLAERRTA